MSFAPFPTCFQKASFIGGGSAWSVVKCITCNLEAPGSSCTGSSGILVRVSLGKSLQSLSIVLVKPRKHINSLPDMPI